MDLVVVRGGHRTAQDVCPGSEELFSHDLITINREDLVTSTLLEAGTCANAAFIVPTTNQQQQSCEDLQHDPDETRINTPTASGPGAVGEEMEQSMGQTEEEQPTTQARSAEDSNSPNDNRMDASDEELERRAVHDTPARLIANEKQRLRRVAVLTDIAKRMAIQSEREEESAASRHRDFLDAERWRIEQERIWREEEREQESLDRKAFLEEAKLARCSLHEALTKNNEIMLAALDIFRKMGESEDREQRARHPLVRQVQSSVGKENSQDGQPSAKRMRVSKKRDILDL